ncbi:aa3-type cytochrome c oxidase subunit IV [Pseudogemmobacter sonorensis]
MADHAQGEHKHGSMDIREHEKTFAGFIKFTTWTTVLIFVVLVILALANA